MREINPFKVFCPSNAKYLVLGSFLAKDAKTGWNYEWYYSNGRNQFWSILEKVYGSELKTLKQQQELFSNLGIAIGDIILSCERKEKSSLDTKLINIEFNYTAIEQVLKTCPIQKILFTSKFVENNFKKNFKDLIDQFPSIELVTLPSPSPRYASMPLKEKILRYAQELPRLN